MVRRGEREGEDGGIDSDTEYMECIRQMESDGRTTMGAKEGRRLVQGWTELPLPNGACVHRQPPGNMR